MNTQPNLNQTVESEQDATQQSGGQTAQPLEGQELDNLFGAEQTADQNVEKPKAEVTLNKPRTWGRPTPTGVEPVEGEELDPAAQQGGQEAQPLEGQELDNLFGAEPTADQNVEKPKAEVTLNKPRTWGEEDEQLQAA